MDFDFYDYNPGYGAYGTSPYMYNNTMSIIGSGILLSLFTIIGLYFILAWIFRSIGLYHMAKNRGIQHAWFAWIPILSQYILGRLINNKVVLGDDIVLKHASFFLPFFSFLNFSVLSDLEDNPFVMFLTAAIWVYNVSALWRLYKIYRPQKRVSYTVWSVILTSGFFIFAIRDDKPFDELEPNKVYENYYGGKRVLDQDLYHDRSEIRAQAREDQERLKQEYKDQLNQPDLTEGERDEIRDNYYTERDKIRRAADDQIKAENQEYYQDLQTLEEDVKDHLNPTVTMGEDGKPIILPQVETEVTEPIRVITTEDLNAAFIDLDRDQVHYTDEVEEVVTPDGDSEEDKQLADSITETIDSINRISNNQYDE